MDTMDPFAATPNGARHAALAELAKTGPLHRLVLPTSVSAWVITSYLEARAALSDPRLVKGGPLNSPFADELDPETFAGVDGRPGHARREPSLLLNKLTALPVRLA